MIRATKGTSLDRWVDGWMDFGKPQGIQKLLKIAKLASAAHLGFPCDLGDDFGTILKGFGWIFGKILVGFLKFLESIRGNKHD